MIERKAIQGARPHQAPVILQDLNLRTFEDKLTASGPIWLLNKGKVLGI